MAALRKLASQTLLYGFTYFAARLLNFFLTPFYTRVFQDTSDYGAVSEIYAYITFINILYTYGMETGFFYFANKRNDDLGIAGTSFISLLFSSLIFSGGILLFSNSIATAAGYSLHPDFIIYAAIILFFDTAAVIPFAYLRKQDRAMRFASLKFINIILTIGFNFLFLVVIAWVAKQYPDSTLAEYSVWLKNNVSPVGMVFLANVLSSIITFLMLLPEVFSFKIKWEKSVFREMLVYSWPLLILGFAGMINETLDRILLKRLLVLPPQNMSLKEALGQVGIYSACYKLSIFMTLAIQSFKYAAEPFFFGLMKQEDSKLIYARVLKYFTFITSIIFMGVMFYMPLLIQLLGERYRSAVDVVPILLLANLFLGIFYYLSQWYKQTEKTIYGAYISIGGALLTVGINVIFIPLYGYMASAYATLICYFSMAAISMLMGKKYYPVPYEYGKIAYCISSAVVLYFISKWVLRDVLHFAPLDWNFAVATINSALIIVYIFIFMKIDKISLSPLLKKLNKS
ncbi:MAG: polysaccharide biosynthesis C-terminal domain-containing protein [Bacteroidetes bacterium]|nr:polysaccharide biosynthesis C-terminal domain-containing protein [Bacteroidota bacterium]